MTLHFTDGEKYVNFDTDAGNYNFLFYPGSNYITVNTKDLDRIYKECDFNSMSYNDDLHEVLPWH